MVWGYGESKLPSVSGAKAAIRITLLRRVTCRRPLVAQRESASLPCGTPPGLALAAGTLCRQVRRLSPEPSERGRHKTDLPLVAPTANLLRTPLKWRPHGLLYPAGPAPPRHVVIGAHAQRGRLYLFRAHFHNPAGWLAWRSQGEL